jgi:hypothetical protein
VSWDKDWEVHLALNDPNSSIHDHIERQLMSGNGVFDPILTKMAEELRAALVERGLDPTSPPEGLAPAGAAFEQYKLRGGRTYSDPQLFVSALIQEVGKPINR